jgi:PRC-barrel domain
MSALFKHIRTVSLLAAVVLVPTALSPRAGPATVQAAEWGGGAEDAVGSPVRRDGRAPAVERGRLERTKLDSVLGKVVRTRVEEDGGRIIDLLADRSGNVEAAVIEFGGFLGIGTRKIAVEWSALRFEADGKESVIVVDVTRDQLRVAPEWKPNEPAIVRRASN